MDIYQLAEAGSNEGLMDFLLEGGDINKPSHDGHTALHHASKSGQLKTVELLLSLRANPKAQTVKGNTPLHGAAYKGQRDVVVALLKAGADKSIKNKDGETALDRATKYGMTEVVEVLK